MPIKKQLDSISDDKGFKTGNEEFIESFRTNIVNENSRFAMKSGRKFLSSDDDGTCNVP